uniref:thiol oxidase n=1 Tax=viral metagenome TaxID=1070528 RepID=A0A6C0HAR6_9ZZZZ
MNMNFTLKPKNNYSIAPPPNNTVYSANFGRKPSVTSIAKSIPMSSEPTVKKMKWGEPTWLLFHTLACKVKEECFQKVRGDLLNHIYSICANLPCPMCANHAMEYMKNINFNAIRTKQDLIDMLYVFHNTVNKKKNYPQFPHSELDSKYSTAVTKNIIFNFLYHFQDKHKSVHMIANDMFRIRQVETLKEWFNKNYNCFEP